MGGTKVKVGLSEVLLMVLRGTKNTDLGLRGSIAMIGNVILFINKLVPSLSQLTTNIILKSSPA